MKAGLAHETSKRKKNFIGLIGAFLYRKFPHASGLICPSNDMFVESTLCFGFSHYQSILCCKNDLKGHFRFL